MLVGVLVASAVFFCVVFAMRGWPTSWSADYRFAFVVASLAMGLICGFLWWEAPSKDQ
jgi:hypothetical protein